MRSADNEALVRALGGVGCRPSIERIDGYVRAEAPVDRAAS